MAELTVKEQVDALLETAMRLMPEGEGIDLSDQDYELEQLVALKNRVSTIRGACDVVNAALARVWKDDYIGERYVDKYNSYYLDKTRGKKAIDKAAFYEWLATKDAAELSMLVADYNIKTGGMTSTERATFLDESPTTDRLSIKSTLRK